MYRYFSAHAKKRVAGWNGWSNGMGNVRQCKGRMDLRQLCSSVGQHHQISQNRHRAGSTRIQGQVRWDWWCDCNQIQSGMVRGQLVEIATSHQIWWNILREHNWGVPSVHINFIYCPRSGSGPPSLMAHFAFFYCCTVHISKVTCYKDTFRVDVCPLKSSCQGMPWLVLKLCSIIKISPEMLVLLI